MFITFEGGEGAGKSTQIKRLAEYLSAKGRSVVLTREPGGTAVAEDIRTILVNGDPQKLSSTAEALLNYAARDSHVRSVIRPALQAGKVVLCDRFMDSTRAYQGFAGDCPHILLSTLENAVVAETMPDLTLIFDLDPTIGLARAHMRGAGLEDRYERKGMSFHRALRAGFLEIATSNPGRCAIVNASLGVDEVWESILTLLRNHGYG